MRYSHKCLSIVREGTLCPPKAILGRAISTFSVFVFQTETPRRERLIDFLPCGHKQEAMCHALFKLVVC